MGPFFTLRSSGLCPHLQSQPRGRAGGWGTAIANISAGDGSWDSAHPEWLLPTGHSSIPEITVPVPEAESRVSDVVMRASPGQFGGKCVEGRNALIFDLSGVALDIRLVSNISHK